MRYAKWTLIAVFVLLVGSLLHYNLPQRDVVFITKTEVRRVDVGINRLFYSNAGAGDAVSSVGRDVFFISAVKANGKSAVYRNEDTGWGWPPYFKFDTADLDAEAVRVISTEAEPTWVAVRHYGWRSNLLSIFPNALSIKPVSGPDVRLIPWTSIVILTLLAGLLFWIWRIWVRFRQKRIEPLVDEIDAEFDEARDKVGGFFSRLFKRRR